MPEKHFLPPIKSAEKGRLSSDSLDDSSRSCLPVLVHSKERLEDNLEDLYESCRDELMATKIQLREEKVKSTNNSIEAKEYRLENLKLQLTLSKHEEMVKKLREQIDGLRAEKKAWLKMKNRFFEEELWKESTDVDKFFGERKKGLGEKKSAGKNNMGEKDSVKERGEKRRMERNGKNVTVEKGGDGKKENVLNRKTEEKVISRRQKDGGRENAKKKLVKDTDHKKIKRNDKDSKSLIKNVESKGKTEVKKGHAKSLTNVQDKPGHGMKSPSMVDIESPARNLEREAIDTVYPIPSVFTPLPGLITWKPPLPPSAKLPVSHRMQRRKAAILKSRSHANKTKALDNVELWQDC